MLEGGKVKVQWKSLEPKARHVGMSGRQFKKMVKLWKREGKPMELENIKEKLK